MVDALPVPALVALDPGASAAYVNVAMRTLLGMPSAKHIINFHTAPYILERNGRRLVREEAPLVRAALGETIAAEPLDFLLHDGRRFAALAFAAPVREIDGAIAGAVASFLDVTALRNSERLSAQRLRVLAEVGQALSEALSAPSIVDALARALLPATASMVLVMTLDDDGRPESVRMAHRDPYTSVLIERLRVRYGLAPNLFGTAMRVARKNAPELIADREDLIESADTSERYRRFVDSLIRHVGIASAIAVPMVSHGRMAGVLMAFSDETHAYQDADVPLFAEIGRRAATALQNATLFAHHEQASTILQEALLPVILAKVPGMTFDAIYAPGDDRALIGGDWYDAFDLPDGRIAVSIGDVTGRGTKAAAQMGKVRQTISGLSFYETDPVKLLDVAELALLRRNPDSLVTAIVGVLDPKTGEFIYATAGHPPPFVRRADGIVLTLPCHGLPLGLRSPDEERSSMTFRLLPGDALLLYTDGLTEVNHDPIAGEEAAKNALANLPCGRSDVATYVREVVLPNGSRDDVALLSVKLDGEARDLSGLVRRRDVLEVKFDSHDARMARDVRMFITDFLRAHGEPDVNYDSAELVLGELLGNTVRHAGGPIELHLSWTGEYPELSMLDSGPPYEAALTVPEDPWSEGGRGLYIVGLLSRSFHVTRLFGGINETRVELDVRRR